MTKITTLRQAMEKRALVKTPAIGKENIKLTFDGFGINDDGEEYKSRLATFSKLGQATPGLAELLVAAPKLLAALKLAYEHINGGPGIKAGAEFQAMWEQINTAIAEAEGRQ